MTFATPNRRPLSHYRPRTPARNLPPLPPKWRQPQRAAKGPPPLTQFVLLSMLLHALAILLFGAPGGGSKEGRALWGALDVVIVRPAPAPPEPPRPAVPAEAPRPAPIPTPAPPPAAAVDAPFAFPPVLDRIAAPERAIEMVPPPQVPAPDTPVPETSPPVAELPKPEAPPVAELPKPEPPPVVEMPPLPAPLPALAPGGAAPAMVEPPPIEAIAAPAPPEPRRAPVEVPAIPATALESLPALAPERATAPMLDAPTIEAPRDETPQAPKAAEPLRIEPGPAPREAPATREAVPLPSPEAPSPFRSPAPKRGPDEAAYDPTAPALDPEALRKRAGALAREGTGNRALLPFAMPPLPPRKSKLETAIENARKPDCKTAYQGLGLAAIVPLIANEFGEGTCRW